ncbi:MAG: NAD-dependent epimerase/dehydratase family protein [Sedimenticolaceae bacterium]
MHVLVTGASGFIGRHLVDSLLREGHRVSCVVRRGSEIPFVFHSEAVARIEIDDIADETDWTTAMQGADALVHLAARVHVMRETEGDSLACFRRVNVLGTQRLAEAAVAAGVRRFVYVSSIKVSGESTADQPFRADDAPAPADPYAVSKLEAEQLLWHLAAASATEFVVVRPPLVYGPGVKGNFARLVQWVRRGRPLPLGAIRNRRSLLAVENLVDFLGVCLVHPRAAGEVFLVADGHDWSTPQLVRAIAAALQRSPRLIPVPVGLLTGAAGLVGRRAAMARLCGSLQVDIAKNRALLQWEPPVDPRQAVARTVRTMVAQAPDD